MAAADRLELVVVRHGLTSWNQERRYQGQRDIPLLLPEALPDLERLREALAETGFDAVHASDLTRCRQTLAHIREGSAWASHPGRRASIAACASSTSATTRGEPGKRSRTTRPTGPGSTAAACGRPPAASPPTTSGRGSPTGSTRCWPRRWSTATGGC